MVESLELGGKLWLRNTNVGDISIWRGREGVYSISKDEEVNIKP